MSSYVTGQKGNNNQVGVYPDNTPDVFDNPRVEYLGELLRRTRGAGFGVGLVTTSDVTDATPIGNAVHTADRDAGPSIAENWMSNRLMQEAAVVKMPPGAAAPTAVANVAGDGSGLDSDNRMVDRRALPGFLVAGTIENGASGCPADTQCPADTASSAHTVAGHTGGDVPLSAAGAGAWQFTGTFENTDVFVKLLRASTGAYAQPGDPAP